VETQRQRVERMARYKEERRQQLASQYGSRDDAGGLPATPQRRFITRSAASTPVRNGDDRSGSGSSSNSEQPSPSSTQRVRTTRTSRLRAAVTSSGAHMSRLSWDGNMGSRFYELETAQAVKPDVSIHLALTLFYPNLFLLLLQNDSFAPLRFAN
jgi:hypothetical protein